MPVNGFDEIDLEPIARRVGTPFFLLDAATLERRIADIREIAPGGTIQPRYAMKACSTRRLLERMHRHGIWIDAVSGNEVLRAHAAGYPREAQPPQVLLTTDVFRDNALEVVRQHGVLPNIGSPHMIDQLRDGGYRGPIGVRVNPGFGHGHVSACDTGGPSSKHGIWHEDLDEVRRAAENADLPIVLLHTHVGSGPEVDEFNANVQHLFHFFLERVESYPHLEAVSFGGGLPHSYRPDAPPADLTPLGRVLCDAQESLSQRMGRKIRVEIEPGRYFVAPAAVLVTRVADVKETRANDRGPGFTFAMVDAGFCDLVRPAMYGAYHHITLHRADDRLRTDVVVAGPLCESGDVFTRDADELLAPRSLPRPAPGDLLLLHDAGAYAASMSSNYNSLGRAPQVWLEDGQATLVVRRETLEDITRTECSEPL